MAPRRESETYSAQPLTQSLQVPAWFALLSFWRLGYSLEHAYLQRVGHQAMPFRRALQVGEPACRGEIRDGRGKETVRDKFSCLRLTLRFF